VFIIGHFGRYTGQQIFPIIETNCKDDSESEQRRIIRLLGYSNGNQGYQQGSSIVSSNGIYGTLDTLVEVKRDIIWDGKRFRRPTPKECFRLQGFSDEYFDRAKQVNSDSQLYKQAGNSVTVNVIYEIAKRLS
jgi:DNA (cytosine-5)-methyltransferase 1